MLDQAIARAAERLIEATVTVALLGPDGRPKRLPAAVREALSRPFPGGPAGA